MKNRETPITWQAAIKWGGALGTLLAFMLPAVWWIAAVYGQVQSNTAGIADAARTQQSLEQKVADMNDKLTEAVTILHRLDKEQTGR